MAIDVGKEMTEVARALNKVRTNGAALVASTTAAAHGKELALQAERLPGEFLRGAASGKALARNLRSAVEAVEKGRKAAEGKSQLELAVSPPWWTTQRRAIERVYIEGAAVYAGQDAAPFRSMAADLGKGVVAYGEKLAAAGAGAPGVLLGDALKVIGKNTGAIVKGAGEAVTDVAGSLLGGLKWPLLIAGGVIVAVAYFAPSGAKRLAVKAATGGIL